MVLPPPPLRFTGARYSSSLRSVRARTSPLFWRILAPVWFTRRFRPFARLFSFDGRETHAIAPRGLSVSHWERTGALIPLSINRLQSGPDAPRDARSGIYDIKRAVR